MLASALRSLVVQRCEDGVPARVQLAAAAVHEASLDGGTATSLAWDESGRLFVTVSAPDSGAHRLRLLRGPGTAGRREEDYIFPTGVNANDVSVCSRQDANTTWAAVACSDGSVRMIDAPLSRSMSVARTSYNHGVAATAVQLSPDGQCIASGSASGHVVVEALTGGHPGPSPLPGAGEQRSATASLRFSPLKPERLASCDLGGNVHVWDVRNLRQLCTFPYAHSSAATGLSFSLHNSDLLISAGDDSQLVFWDVSTGRQIREVTVESRLASLSYHTGGYLVAAGTCEGSIFVFDLRMLVSKAQPALPVQRFEQHQTQGGGALRALAFAPADLDPGGDWSGPPEAALAAAPDRPPISVDRPVALDRTTERPVATATERPGAVDRPVVPDRPLAGTAERSSAVDRPSMTDRPSAAAERLAGYPAEKPGAVPTSATLLTMMGRLNFRGTASSGTTTPVAPPPEGSARRSASARGDPARVDTARMEARRGSHDSESGRDAEVLEFSHASSEPSRPLPAKPAAVPPLPATPAEESRRGSLLREALETPAGPQSGRYLIGSTPQDQQSHLTASPWRAARTLPPERPGWREEPAASAPLPGERARSVGGPELVEALRPLLAEMREEILNEVRDAHCAQLEQSFRLQVELQRSVEELREEVRQLRGELRVL